MKVSDLFNLSGQVAIVTGAGQGIGHAIALAYADAGADVVCAARTLTDVEQVAAQIQASGRKALALSCDVSREQDRQALVSETLEAMGKITHLVNTVGGGGPNDPLTLPPEAFSQYLDFNITTSYALTQLCVPHMQDAGRGNVINITSAAARYIQPHFSAYGAAKAALTHLTKLLAQDFAPKVRVNAIAPGPIVTDALTNLVSEEILSAMADNTPLKRLGSPEDIAAAALYLATPASGWVTGKVIEVDGGAETTVWPG